ncbi:hypothetical protein P3H15_32785 [Rhodococcus sp. T2V]|uniref:DNA polymerase III subunit beta family protein n=1 Tax=Rhodococcus sp. T2V TaxID=3034164 RepID=UPI0023E15E33|nr:hypothetical protein [Rhodococcus sp. T2V]MDF3309797.1 hypothetical protein [Rhodococcus sp. T2V]
MSTKSFVIARSNLVRAVDTALAFSGTDSTLPMICGVELSIHKGKLIVAATDRFRLGIVRMSVEDRTGRAGRIGFVGRDSAVRLLKVIRGGRGHLRDAPIAVTVEGEQISFAFDFTTLAFALQDSEFPDVKKHIAASLANEGTSERWAMNPVYLASFQKAMWSRGDKAIIKTPPLPARPVLITVGEHFIGLQMPVRETDLDSNFTSWNDFLAEEVEEKVPAKKSAPARKAPAKKAAPARRAPASKAPATKKAPVKKAAAPRKRTTRKSTSA